MPTYEYECEECGYRFERFQSITARTVRKCPRCGRLKVRRMVGTGAAVIFKGPGFYATDYRSEEYRQRAKQDKAHSDSDSKKQGSHKETGSAE